MVCFCAQLLANALTLALYAVQAFGEHDECVTASGRDITERFTLTFKMGFFLHSAVFVNQTYIDPYFSLRSVFNKDKATKSTSSILASISYSFDWVMGVAVALLSALMLFQVNSAESRLCHGAGGSDILTLEAKWLYTLAIWQVIKLIASTFIWSKYG